PHDARIRHRRHGLGGRRRRDHRGDGGGGSGGGSGGRSGWGVGARCKDDVNQQQRGGGRDGWTWENHAHPLAVIIGPRSPCEKTLCFVATGQASQTRLSLSTVSSATSGAVRVCDR